MKNFIKKLLPYILTVAIAVGCTTLVFNKKLDDCNYTAYESGFGDGRNIGYEKGYDAGCREGRSDHADMINFVDNHVVFCTDQGEKYHKFDCYHFQNNRDSFYAFNISYAEHLGYEPCSDCFG